MVNANIKEWTCYPIFRSEEPHYNLRIRQIYFLWFLSLNITSSVFCKKMCCHLQQLAFQRKGHIMKCSISVVIWCMCDMLHPNFCPDITRFTITIGLMLSLLNDLFSQIFQGPIKMSDTLSAQRHLFPKCPYCIELPKVVLLLQD